MDWIAVVSVLAILLSPLVAVLVTRWLDDRRQLRSNKQKLFWDIFGHRHQPVSNEYVRSLNLIDVIYYDCPSVRHVWRDLYDMFGNEGLQNPAGFEQRRDKAKQLMVEMARAAGYGKAIDHLDVNRVYYPEGLSQQEAVASETAIAIQDLLQRSLLVDAKSNVGGSGNINTPPDYGGTSGVAVRSEQIPPGHTG